MQLCLKALGENACPPLGKLPALEKMGEGNTTNLCKSLCSFTHTLAGPN